MPLTSSHGLLRSRDLLALLEAADIHRSSTIRVTGPSGLSALLWLCRHGYDQVGYLRSDQRGPHDEADAVLVAHTCDEVALIRILAAGPQVREGGALIVQTPQIEPDRFRRLLERAGYNETQHLRGERRDLHVARRHVEFLRKAA